MKEDGKLALFSGDMTIFIEKFLKSKLIISNLAKWLDTKSLSKESVAFCMLATNH